MEFIDFLLKLSLFLFPEYVTLFYFPSLIGRGKRIDRTTETTGRYVRKRNQLV